MKNYKLAVSKNGKKYTIVFKSETEKQARERVHKEWYSILSIEENTQKRELGNIFIFSAYTKEWELKNWKIVWDDIFKTYVKLRKNLDYDVKGLFSQKDINATEEEKELIMRDLKEEYNILYKKEEEKELKKEKETNKDKELDSFYLKKELEETYKLLDFVLEKLQNLITWQSSIELDPESKEKLKNVYNSIIKLKKSTNLSKLKEIWELALLKIWRIELEEVEKKHEEKGKLLLKETNSLLKKIWSKEVFVEKHKDVWFLINSFFEKLNTYFLSFKKEKKEEIDKHSHSYIKNALFLKRYKNKLQENNIEILKNLFLLPFKREKRRNLFIKRRVIKQNIVILKAREWGFNFSYTSIKKWFNKIFDYILVAIENIRLYLFVIILIYTLVFILFLNINYYYNIKDINYEWIFYFTLLLFVYILLYFSRNTLLIILNFVILFFIVIFWVVNF